MECSVEDCSANVYALGYCNRHYNQIRKHGCIQTEHRMMPNEFVIEGDICRIGLRDNRGQIVAWAVVDAEDAQRCMEYKWNLHIYGRDRQRTCTTQIKQDNGKFKRTRLHKFIMRTNRLVDHIDRDPLNNRKSNLRRCTSNDNARNKGMQRNNTSGYKGVSRCGNKWRACIAVDGKNRHIGLFPTPEEAAQAYNAKAIELHGEYAYQNVVGQ